MISKHICKKVLWILVIIAIFHSCGLVWDCRETKRTIRKAQEYKNCVPLSFYDLKQLICNDTLHYKVVVFYSPCCGPCTYRFQNIYPEKIKQFANNNVSVYFILESTGGLKYSEKFQKMLNIPIFTQYYLRDSNYSYVENTSQDIDVLSKLTNNMFDNANDVISLGIPHCMIVNKQGDKIMLQICKFNDNVVATTPLSLDQLNISFDSLDFDRPMSDTLFLNWEAPEELSYKKYCNPNNKQCN